MKKVIGGIVLLLVVAVIVTMGIMLFQGPGAAGELVEALEQMDEAVAAGEDRDMTGALAVLEGESERSRVVCLSFAVGLRAAQGKGCAVIGALTLELLQQGKLKEADARDVVTAVLLHDPVNSAWLPEDRAEAAAMLALLKPDDLALALTRAVVEQGDAELCAILADAAERLSPAQREEVVQLRSEQGLLPIF